MISLLVDLMWIGVSALAGHVAKRRAAAGIALPRDAVLRGWRPAASEIEELLRDMLSAECARRWPVPISDLSNEELAALRMQLPSLIRRPEYEGRIMAELVAPLYELVIQRDIELERRLQVHCYTRQRRPFFVTGRLLHRVTWGLLGMSKLGSYRCLDIDALRADQHTFAQWILTHGLGQLHWLDTKIARGLVLEERRELPWESRQSINTPVWTAPTSEPAVGVSEPEPEPEPEPEAGLDPELVAAAERLVAEASELIDDEEFWVADDAHEQIAPILDALREAIDHHPDPVEVERVKGAIESRLADVLAYDEFFEECMREEFDAERWPRCLSLAFSSSSEQIDPEEFRLLAKRNYIFGPVSDRECRPLEDDAEEADNEAEASEPTLSLVPSAHPKPDFRRAETLF